VAVFTTKHGKERVIARPLQAALGLTVTVADTIDTDLLGTFTGAGVLLAKIWSVLYQAERR